MSDFTTEYLGMLEKDVYEWKENNIDYNIIYDKLIKKNNLNGSELFMLGKLSKKEKNNIPEAIKYYKMAIKKGNDDRASQAMTNLGYLYRYDKKNIIELFSGSGASVDTNLLAKAIKYYKMAIEKGNDTGMYNLGCLYEEENNIPDAIKYYKMAIEKGNEYAMNNLVKLYKEVNSNYLKKLICEMNKLEDENEKLKKKNERLKTKLKYMPPPSGGIGYHEAKEDFDKLCGK